MTGRVSAVYPYAFFSPGPGTADAAQPGHAGGNFLAIAEGDDMKPNRTLIAISAGAALAAVSAMSFASPRANDRTIVGAWRTQVTLVNCNTGQPVGAPPIIGLSTFNLGGTMSEWGVGPGTTPAMRSPSTGVWERGRGWRNHSFTFTFYRYDASGVFIGSQRVTADAELAASGDSYESISAVEVLDASDNVVATACATSVGTRIE